MKSILATALLVSAFSVQAAPRFAPCTYTDAGVSDGRFVRVEQTLPVGHTMTATLTGNTGTSDRTIFFGSTPASCGGTTQAGDTGLFFYAPEFIITDAKLGTTVKVTDYHQKHSDPNVGDGTIEIAAFVASGQGQTQAAGLAGWLYDNGYVGTHTLTVPDFIKQAMSIFYGVDLTVWSAVGFDVDASLLGGTFDIVNGTSHLLPGYVFSNDPLSLGNGGWGTSSPFSGTVTLDSFHSMSLVVPEPGGLALFGLAAMLLIATRASVQRRSG